MATTNDGSNYWTVKMRTETATVTADISGATVNTSAESPDTWVTYSVSVGTAVAAAANVIGIRATKTGSPGALYWGASLVVYS